MRDAKISLAAYENVEAECPHCGHPNIFNRVSDLRDTDPIARADVTCQRPECARPFAIIGDSINAAFEMLIYECYDLMQRRRFSNCIANLTQAFEMFFALALRLELAMRPAVRQWGREAPDDLNRLNDVLRLLFEHTKRWPYEKMRDAFLDVVLRGVAPADLAEAARAIKALRPRTPTDHEIEAYTDGTTGSLLKDLRQCEVHKLRNKVVHKHGYRPSREEVQDALDTTRSILFGLAARLDVKTDDLNFLLARERSRPAARLIGTLAGAIVPES